MAKDYADGPGFRTVLFLYQAMTAAENRH